MMMEGPRPRHQTTCACCMDHQRPRILQNLLSHQFKPESSMSQLSASHSYEDTQRPRQSYGGLYSDDSLGSYSGYPHIANPVPSQSRQNSPSPGTSTGIYNYSPSPSESSGYHSSSPRSIGSPSPPATFQSTSPAFFHSPSPARGLTPSPSSQMAPQTESKLFNILSVGRIPRLESQSEPTSPVHRPKRPLSIETEQNEPMDLTCKKPRLCLHADSKLQSKRCSLLEKILRRNAPEEYNNELCQRSRPGHEEHVVGRSPARSYSGNPQVTLAKKNMLPVSARVSDWLVKVVQFANSLPQFEYLSHNDEVTLVLNSWSRLLLLHMAETNFEFAVTPIHGEGPEDSRPAAPETPTMKSVESIQGFIMKCQALGIDSEEYRYLRLSTLFNPGYPGLEDPRQVEQFNSDVRQSLQDHIAKSRNNEKMRYSQLLMCLPYLYGISHKMVENLFCKHITGNTDMEVLLKEMLQSL